MCSSSPFMGNARFTYLLTFQRSSTPLQGVMYELESLRAVLAYLGRPVILLSRKLSTVSLDVRLYSCSSERRGTSLQQKEKHRKQVAIHELYIYLPHHKPFPPHTIIESVPIHPPSHKHNTTKAKDLKSDSRKIKGKKSQTTAYIPNIIAGPTEQ